MATFWEILLLLLTLKRQDFVHIFSCLKNCAKNIVWIQNRGRNRNRNCNRNLNFSKVGKGTATNHYGSTTLYSIRQL